MRKAIMFMTVILLLGFMDGEAAAARSGGAFNFCIPYGGDVLTLDPHKGARVNDMIVMMSLNRSLYSWDPENNRPELELGERADVSPDDLVYRIHLKKNVKCHNGRGMTADDVIWSYERIMSPKVC